ncbi:MAG: 4a-hydroxytetrahydrobiopterin dehydratase [Myxococcota bacterium]
MSILANEPVVPAKPGTPPLDETTAASLLSHLASGWEVQGDALVRRYAFVDFAQALAFVNAVGAEAETVQHHPDVALSYGSVTLKWTTHDIGGLGRADFVMAARSDRHFEDAASTAG